LPDTGAKWVRLTFDWSKLEKSRGSYDSATLATWDRAVSLSRQAGTRVVADVYNTPGWASSNGSVGGAPTNNSDFANTMSFLANRYRGQVQAWEIWNEENTQRFWTSGPDASRYASLLRAAYPAVKAADPGATVLFGGTFGNDGGYIAAAYQAGAKGYFDAMAVHPYSGASPPEATDGGYAGFPGYRGIRNLMLAWGDDKPIWLTEFGWSTTSAANGVGYGAAGEATQADYLTRAYRLTDEDPYVQVAIWYNFRNNFWNKDANGWEYQCGLLYTTFAPKRSYAAFKSYVPGAYVPPVASAAAQASSTAVSATSSPVGASDARNATRTILSVTPPRVRVGASRRRLSTVLVRGTVRGSHGGRVTLRVEPMGRPLRALVAVSRTATVGRDGRFSVRLRVRSARWRLRGTFGGSRTARPSRSRFVVFRV
jgi:hypothetical protein